MKLTLHVWRQKNAQDRGIMETYHRDDVSEDMSFLEMLDELNEDLIKEGKEPVAFDHDCREGICGACSLAINGQPHGPIAATTTCQLHMRKFKDGDELYIEPFRARAFPILRDLITDRESLDKIIQAGGYVSVNTGTPQDANSIPISKENADIAMDAAACIGCGACVASCPNGAAMLFTSAKITQFVHLPQGQAERKTRALKMVNTMEANGFGACRNYYECEAVCPKEIPARFISKMNWEYVKATAKAIS
jgi:succinate dehydrogenase / fumarate reductase iron-sulfur subunit